jgi:hypothetical protein
MIQGSCLCGAMRYELAGPFSAMMHCHCSMCRKHHGSLYATFALAPIAGFGWLSGEDQGVAYHSSEHGVRTFCKTCGSVAPMLVPKLGFAVVPAGNLLGDPGIRPQQHIFVGSKATWHEITDALPQHAAMPPDWGGGTGLTRPAVTPREGITEGSCLCGDVAFEHTGRPQRAYHCHCTRCQRGRSAAHASNFFYSADGFRFTRGEDRVASFKLPDAQFFTVAFCKRCGSGVPRLNRERGMVVVPGGCLDVDPGARPLAHIFVGSKAAWDVITDTTPQFAEYPP